LITKKQQKAIELMFEGNLSQKQISEIVKVHETTLSRWKHEDSFIEATKEYTKKVISQSTSKAMSTMVNLLNAKSELVRFNAAKDLLDRAGFAPTDNVNVNANINPVQIVDDIPEDDSDG